MRLQIYALITLYLYLTHLQMLQAHWISYIDIKLDGVGPVDNRPSTDQLHHFVHFFSSNFFLFLFIFYFFILFFLFFFFGQSGEVYRWRVCYQRGLPRLVFIIARYLKTLSSAVQCCAEQGEQCSPVNCSALQISNLLYSEVQCSPGN